MTAEDDEGGDGDLYRGTIASDTDRKTEKKSSVMCPQRNYALFVTFFNAQDSSMARIIDLPHAPKRLSGSENWGPPKMCGIM